MKKKTNEFLLFKLIVVLGFIAMILTFIVPLLLIHPEILEERVKKHQETIQGD